MKTEINLLIEKYSIQRNTISELIKNTDGEKEPENLSKYKSVHRFISNFIDDLTAVINPQH